MPARLTRGFNPQFLQQDIQSAAQAKAAQRIVVRSPWGLYAPDLDPYNAPPNTADAVEGLVARPGSFNRGEVLIPDCGFAPIDPDRLPLGGAPSSAVTMIADFNRTLANGTQDQTDHNITPLVFIAGDNSTAGTATLYRIPPSTGQWTAVTWTGGSGPPDREPDGDRDQMWDWAVMPEGAPLRGAGAGTLSGNITEPVIVMCNGHDDVAVMPEVTGNSGYEMLTDLASLAPFIAKTVEAFNGRLYFGNVSEANNQFRQRVRRTAVFTANPDPTLVGSGAIDFREFSGDLLRLEKLGPLLACYFEDGTAFIRPTNIATAPDDIQILREKRGLLGTFAVTSIADNAHFGIFTDGWYIIDASGRWTEVGLTNIDGKAVSKWKRAFYEDLDNENRQRLFVHYDGELVRIAYPRSGNSDVQEVWFYDPRADRVSTERYPSTYWGSFTRIISTAATWEDMTDTWDTIMGSWADFAARFGLEQVAHGTSDGFVVQHDPSLFTRYNTITDTQDNPAFLYRTHLSSLGDPRAYKVARSLWLEFIQSAGTPVTFKVFGNTFDGSESGTVDMAPTGSSPGEVILRRHTFNFTARNMGFELSGAAPIQIRSIEGDVDLRQAEVDGSGDSL